MTVDDHQYRVQLIANEVDICKQLSSNDLKKRKKGLISLKKLLGSDHITEVDADDFNRIWNGLFNYVWMSDTPLVQEADVENISNLIHHIRSFDAVMLFVRGFFSSIANQWNRISHHRTDKFLMFIRRFLRQVLFLLRNSSWNAEKLEAFGSELYSALQILPVGLIQHLNDIFNEELAKVSEGIIPTDALILLLKCYVDCIVNMKPSKTVINHINTNIFCALVRQVKLLIKQKAAVELDPEAFALENAAGEPNDAIISENNSNFDPRPGNAHVFLPYIEFEEDKIAKYLENLILTSKLNLKSRNILYQIKEMFQSVTRLRQTIKQPEKLFHEVNEKEKKRKKKPGKFSSIVKKACRRLEEEDDDQTTKKIKKLLRNNVWEVTDDVVANSKAQSAQRWTVTDLSKKDSVSFNEKIDSFFYQAEFNVPDEPSTVSITVPKSSYDENQSILTSNQNYRIVDFKNFDNDETNPENEKEISSRNEEEAPCEPPWKEVKFNSVSDANADVDTSLPLKKRFRKSDEMVMPETEAKPGKKTRSGEKTEDDIFETASVNSDFESIRAMSSDAESEVSLGQRKSRRSSKLSQEVSTVVEDRRTTRRSTRGMCSDNESIASDISPLKTRRSTRRSTRNVNSDAESVASDVSRLRTRGKKSFQSMKQISEVAEEKIGARKSVRGNFSDTESITYDISPLKTRSSEKTEDDIFETVSVNSEFKSIRAMSSDAESEASLGQRRSRRSSKLSQEVSTVVEDGRTTRRSTRGMCSDNESIASDISPLKTRRSTRRSTRNVNSDAESVASDVSRLRTRGKKSFQSMKQINEVAEEKIGARKSVRGNFSDTESITYDISPLKTRSSEKTEDDIFETVSVNSDFKSIRAMSSDAESEASLGQRRSRRSSKLSQEVSTVVEDRKTTRRSTRGMCSDNESIASDISPLKTRRSTRRSTRNVNSDAESVASDVSPLRTRGKKSFQPMKRISEVAEEKIGAPKSVRGNRSNLEK